MAALDASGEMTQETKRRAEVIGIFMCLGWAVAELPRMAAWGIDRLRDLGHID